MESEATSFVPGEPWRRWSEKECEQNLEVQPTDNRAKFRLAEIYITQARNFPIARKLINSVR